MNTPTVALDNNISQVAGTPATSPAEQAVKHAIAIAAQDAASHLRSVETICSTVIGLAIAQSLGKNGELNHMKEIVAVAERISKDAQVDFLMFCNTSIDEIRK